MIFCLLTLMTLLSSTTEQDGSGSSQNLIVVRLTGFQSLDGVVRIAVFDSDEFWPEDIDNSVWKFVSSVSGDAVEVEVEGLEPGSYAISAFHDRDGDAVLDRNILGIPTEKYGFSNNVRSRTGPPDFSDALVVFGGGTLLLEIGLE